MKENTIRRLKAMGSGFAITLVGHIAYNVYKQIPVQGQRGYSELQVFKELITGRTLAFLAGSVFIGLLLVYVRRFTSSASESK